MTREFKLSPLWIKAQKLLLTAPLNTVYVLLWFRLDQLLWKIQFNDMQLKLSSATVVCWLVIPVHKNIHG